MKNHMGTMCHHDATYPTSMMWCCNVQVKI